MAVMPFYKQMQMHSCNHSCSPWIRIRIRIEELLHYSRGPHQNMFLERSWNRMHESTWRTLMLCLQSGGQSMPPMLSEWNSGTQRHIICSFEHWLFIWSLFVQCSIVRNDTWYMIPPANRETFVKPISCVKYNTHQLWRIEYNTSSQAVQASNTS